MRAVLDTNVLVSAALNPNGAPGRVEAEAFRLRFTLVASERLPTELRNVLSHPRITARLPSSGTAAFLEAIEGVALLVVDPDEAPAVTRHPDDDHLVALALAAGADRIVSGDDDLLGAEGLPVAVATPRAFLDELGPS